MLEILKQCSSLLYIAKLLHQTVLLEISTNKHFAIVATTNEFTLTVATTINDYNINPIQSLPYKLCSYG